MIHDSIINPEKIVTLPIGFRDILSPHADAEAKMIDVIMSIAISHGYMRVKPTLVEFENTLFNGPGLAISEQVFRLIDPISQHMIGLRADMTTQAARIASTIMIDAPRPVRLCYAGEVLLTTTNQLNPERELVQIGAELIGNSTADADAEVILLAIESLHTVGVKSISLDIMIPALVPLVLADMRLPAEIFSAVRQAINQKDIATVERLANSKSSVLVGLLKAFGPCEEAMRALSELELPDKARDFLVRPAEVIKLITNFEPNLSITVDPAENRGFEYHTGIAFSLFARGGRNEIGRGGRYQSDKDPKSTATGFTIYLERVLQILPKHQQTPTVYIPYGTPREQSMALRTRGQITIAGLTPVVDNYAEAKRMGCKSILLNGQTIDLSQY
ncbi:tRNA synthetase class II core domain family protein [Candidatus Endolissoclinum faulkneri L2]|uniref:ATP phosphoribosyltransferase regulatory subunit n=1 Tax=Candidatus Endolissoclinum faulkneri L2 TaxID=1193729 RepID=K7ZC68_9PROT|nr:ATP phosphoribosyltransferase regulatory subunit [Candidatus Endolissoclinum faulkneri]AFX98351.1 tRNA synthetase class II core domain family protein [Candidatus Endolissoclinum faulkneri L2]